MKSKIDDYVKEYLNYQFELVDSLEKSMGILNSKSKKELPFIVTMVGHIYNIFYRIKGVKDLLKSVADYDVEIPEKYVKYLKGLKEPFYIKDNVLYTETDDEVIEIINILKSTKDE